MTNIYAGNLDFATSEDEPDRDTAIRALDGSVQGGRILLVNEARPKLYPSGERQSPASRDHRHHRI